MNIKMPEYLDLTMKINTVDLLVHLIQFE